MQSYHATQNVNTIIERYVFGLDSVVAVVTGRNDVKHEHERDSTELYDDFISYPPPIRRCRTLRDMKSAGSRRTSYVYGSSTVPRQ